MSKLSVAVLAAGLAIAGLAWGQDPSVDAAKRLFGQFVALEQAYDPAIADLYADDALIKTRRKAPMGEPRDVVIPASNYKLQLREQIAATKAQGNRNTYSDVTFTVEGELVRIHASRFSETRKLTTPLSLLVGPSPAGKWVIYEELSESPP